MGGRIKQDFEKRRWRTKKKKEKRDWKRRIFRSYGRRLRKSILEFSRIDRLISINITALRIDFLHTVPLKVILCITIKGLF